jgi:hypothetical protein
MRCLGFFQRDRNNVVVVSGGIGFSTAQVSLQPNPFAFASMTATSPVFHFFLVEYELWLNLGDGE